MNAALKDALKERYTLLSTNHWYKILDNTDSVMAQILLFRNGYYNLNKNFQIITPTIEYILSSKRFDEPLLWNCIFAPLIFGSWWKSSVGFVYVQVTSADVSYHRVGTYLFKVSNGKPRTMCKICSKLTIKTLEWCHWCRSDVFIDNSE